MDLRNRREISPNIFGQDDCPQAAAYRQAASVGSLWILQPGASVCFVRPAASRRLEARGYYSAAARVRNLRRRALIYEIFR